MTARVSGRGLDPCGAVRGPHVQDCERVPLAAGLQATRSLDTPGASTTTIMRHQLRSNTHLRWYGRNAS